MSFTKPETLSLGDEGKKVREVVGGSRGKSPRRVALIYANVSVFTMVTKFWKGE